MTTLTLSQTEPPGAPRENPWPEPVPPASEPPGDPRETPWPDEDDERGE
ncbi:MAG: hypothetical protein H0U84_09610 [Thermoleophilaceae bacterium]|nr:hypothetical protein [Thermoleophilaceae bacterium]